LNRIDY
jgi:hypothetical protein